jgi:hypothetical protein
MGRRNRRNICQTSGGGVRLAAIAGSLAMVTAFAQPAQAQTNITDTDVIDGTPTVDLDNNPPGPRGGPGTNGENPPGPRGGPGASPDRRRGRVDPDNNPPGPRGGPGTNWENPPGPRGGPGASPDANRGPAARPQAKQRAWGARGGGGRAGGEQEEVAVVVVNGV